MDTFILIGITGIGLGAQSKWFKTMTAKKLACRFSDFSFAGMGLQP